MKILLFGAGHDGRTYLETMQQSDEAAQIVGFVDNGKAIQGTTIEGVSVYAPERIKDLAYDQIIITPYKITVVNAILEQLSALGVARERIDAVIFQNEYDENTDARVLWLKNFSEYAQMHQLAGNVAECGVYRGYFSEFINKYFPDKKLYLFDTFEGFSTDDLTIERGLNHPAFVGNQFDKDDAFEDSSVEFVLQRMAHRENCVVRQGFFPDSAVGVEDTFCFVSLDMDLYQPMLAGLHFFWDKMTPGGIMLLHDYFHPALPGVKQAVETFEQETGICLPKAPIGDFCSLAVIKPA